jgi:hypothetical protein
MLVAVVNLTHHYSSMKTIVLIISVLCLFSLVSEAGTTKQIITDYKVDTLPTISLIFFLQQMNVDSFYGKPVDSFLLAIPSNFYNPKVYGGFDSQGALFRASYIIIYFTQNIYGPCAIIHVTEYTHMNRYSPTMSWNATLFRKEKISWLSIYSDQNTCINGDCLH